MSSIQIARFTIGLSWMYHGIFPKLVHIAPLEKAMTATLGLSPDIAYWITKVAGVGEVIFGCLLILFYRNYKLIQLNILALLGLLAFVIVMKPMLLIEAFNPVTTNLTLIALSVVLLNDLKYKST